MSGTYGSVTRTTNDFQSCAQGEYARTSKKHMKIPAPTAHIIVNGVKNGPANIHNKEMDRGPNGPRDIQRLVKASDTEQQADDITKIDFKT